MNGVRLATLGLLAVALVGLWKALSLERWSFEGPGPGLFPSLVALTCVILALIVLIAPGRATPTADEAEAPAPPAEAAAADASLPPPGAAAGRDPRKTFAWTAVALLALALGPQWAGFAGSTLMVSILVLRLAEGRSWRLTLGYGCAAALIGLVLFGGLLRVDLPVTALDRAVISLVR
jgi:hypothetical protein